MESLGFLRTWWLQASQTSHRGLKTERAHILTDKLGAAWPSTIQPQKLCVRVCVCVSCSVVSGSATPWTVALRILRRRNSPGKNTGVGYHFLLQMILSDPGIEPRSSAL